ncbi:putative RNA ligase [Paratrimastix pyriformis]|uniref:RNA ligase n=1 Tax=Paratrimastix pyriformis TaxID=342808 RepID=A0ABQ8UNE4_9EUKA|nr:putative RNA ligase [Paratrimastix pyriformis]
MSRVGPRDYVLVRPARPWPCHVPSFCRRIVAKGMDRFFNYGERSFDLSSPSMSPVPAHPPPTETASPDAEFDFDHPFITETKEDGTLVMLFQYEGHWVLSTRHNFGEDRCEGGGCTYQQLFQRTCGGLSLDEIGARLQPGVTYCIELCTMANLIVRPYPVGACYLLCGSDMTRPGFPEMPADFIDRMAAASGVFKRPQRHPCASLAEVRAKLEELSRGEITFEGLVLRDAHGQRTKIKSARYLSVYWLRYRGWIRATPAAMVPFILAGEHRELLASLAHVRTPAEMAEYAARVDTYSRVLNGAFDRLLPDRAAFAKAVAGAGPLRPILMDAWIRRMAPKGLAAPAPPPAPGSPAAAPEQAALGLEPWDPPAATDSPAAASLPAPPPPGGRGPSPPTTPPGHPPTPGTPPGVDATIALDGEDLPPSGATEDDDADEVELLPADAVASAAPAERPVGPEGAVGDIPELVAGGHKKAPRPPAHAQKSTVRGLDHVPTSEPGLDPTHPKRCCPLVEAALAPCSPGDGIAARRPERDAGAPFGWRAWCHCGQEMQCQRLKGDLLVYRECPAATLLWVCPCGLTHECHQRDGHFEDSDPFTKGQPLGVPASALCKSLRLYIHDLLADYQLATRCDKGTSYLTLARLLGIPRSACHMATMDVPTCRQACLAMQNQLAALATVPAGETPGAPDATK